MTPNAFIGKLTVPTDPELATALGNAKSVWDQLLAELEQDFGLKVREWKCYSPKTGWSMRVKRKERTIVWLGPHEGSFQVVYILGDKAMQAARATKFPARIVKAIAEAPKYMEGSGVRLTMKTPRDVPAVKRLAAIKIEN
jgi:hypothetical protein